MRVFELRGLELQLVNDRARQCESLYVSDEALHCERSTCRI